MAIEYFCCYHSYARKLAKLSDQEVGRLFRALLEYSEHGECPELAGRESVAFDFISDDIDRAKEAYREKCAKNSQKGKLGGRPKKQELIEKAEKAAGFSESQKSQNKDKDKTKDIPPMSPQGDAREKTRFVPPTVDEVRAYCQERRNGIDPEAFVAFYASNGWKVGKNAMKNWRAAVITWERKRAKETGPSPGERPSKRTSHIIIDENGEEVVVFGEG